MLRSSLCAAAGASARAIGAARARVGVHSTAAAAAAALAWNAPSAAASAASVSCSTAARFSRAHPCLSRSFSSSASARPQPAASVINGTAYCVPSARATVCILVDGGSQAYWDAASAAGATPFLDSLLARKPGLGAGGPADGVHALVSGQIPSLTNPNNVAIACGAPASQTGICGNYFLDESVPGAPVERLMNSAEFMRLPTVWSRLQADHGLHVTVLTAKDKLLRLLSKDLAPGEQTLAFSIETLGKTAAAPAAGAAPATATSTAAESLTPTQAISLHRGTTLSALTEEFYSYYTSRPGLLASLDAEQARCIERREVPSIYNPHISLYLLELGLQLVKADLARKEEGKRSVVYLSTTDFVQHKFMPTSPEATEFYRYIDGVLRRLHEAGAVFGLTADHGMESKVGFDGKPKVVFLSEALVQAGVKAEDFTVILPITDPYVRHHSSLGGYATIYLKNKSPAEMLRVLRELRKLPGIYTAMNRQDACAAFELPPDRVGDLVILGDESTVLGKSRADHDLDAVPHLRSHGSMSEATVPMIINRRLKHEYERRMTTGKTRNYHLLDMLCNGVDGK